MYLFLLSQKLFESLLKLSTVNNCLCSLERAYSVHFKTVLLLILHPILRKWREKSIQNNVSYLVIKYIFKNMPLLKVKIYLNCYYSGSN